MKYYYKRMYTVLGAIKSPLDCFYSRDYGTHNLIITLISMVLDNYMKVALLLSKYSGIMFREISKSKVLHLKENLLHQENSSLIKRNLSPVLFKLNNTFVIQYS